MKKLLALLTVTIGAAASFGATPIAVWDGNFAVDQTGYNLNRSGNAISADNSTITIDQDVGVKVDFTTGFTDAMTVMFKYSDLSFDAQKTIATSFCSGGDENRTGVYLASGGTVNGIWNTANWGNPGEILSASSGVLAFCYHKSNGTALYYVSAGSRTQLYNKSNLKASGDTAINGCTIGGERAKTGATLLSAATGMKITGIAVFNGTLSEADMTGYVWPSEVQEITVNANTSVSTINGHFDSTNYKKAKVSVADGVTITVDEAFGANILSVSSEGTVTLSAASQPDASYFSAVDFSCVKGGLIRSWLTPGVAGFNFRSANGSDVSGALVACENWIHDNNSANGTSTAMFADGLSTLTWSSANTWACSGSTIISGYLDDGANGGNGAAVTLSNVPYETYDVVVYCSSDSDPGKFLAKTVNGTAYTWDSSSGTTVAGNSVWGKAAISIPVYGVNALRVKNLSGPLTIYGTARNGDNRGGIAAIQIMPPGTPDNIRTYTLTLNGTATTWSGGKWTLDGHDVDAPTSGNVKIVATASTALTVDSAVSLADLVVTGAVDTVINVATNGTGGSLYAIKATLAGGVFQQGSDSVLGATPIVVVEDGATLDLNGLGVNSATAFTIAGAGAGNWPWALTSSSGAGGAILGGLYLSANATIGGAYELKVGQTQAGYQCHLQGFTLTKTGAGALTCTNMNTPGTGTIDVQGGAMSVNQWNNLNNNGGDTTIILRSGTSLANGTDRVVPMGALGLLGGTLSTTRAFKVNTVLRGAGETANLAFGNGASASLTGDLTVTAALTLDGSVTFLKDVEAVADVVVTPTSLTASSGTITVGAGVTLNLGENRPAATITVIEGGTLAAQMQNATDIIELSTSTQPANVILYDASGNVVSSPSVSYSDGTLTIMPPVPTLRPTAVVTDFGVAANWDDSTMPAEGGKAIIVLSGPADIRVDGNYTLDSLTFTGSTGAGSVCIIGSGSLTVGTIYLKNGTALLRGANISATGIDLASGTTLRINGYNSLTESAVISGAGSVEIFGTVTMNAANTFTGGITVKRGSTLSTTTASGFGKDNSGSAYSALSQITVEDGGCVDLNNTKDHCYALTIAGDGVLLANGTYSGAVKNTGVAMGYGARQTASLTLTGDATVDVSSGWGIVQSSYNEAYLALNGHTLTFRGTGTVPMVNVNASNSSGTIVLDGADLQLSNVASDLTGVNIVAKGCSTINLATAPSHLGSLTIAPKASGTTATAWNLPSGIVPVVNTSNVDSSGYSDGAVITLFTAPSGTTLTSETINAQVSGRYTAAISGNTVTAMFHTGLPTSYLHYDFDASAAAASDSMTSFTVAGENSDITLSGSRNGQAIQVHTGFTPWWDTVANGISPFHDGRITVTAVAKLRETNIILWGLGAAASYHAMGLVALDANTVAVVARRGASNVETLVTVTGTKNLMRGWHFFAVVSDENGTTLYVDDKSASSANGVPAGIGQQGQLGSFHGGAFGASKVGSDGYLLDDWRVYDTALTAGEIKALNKQLLPPPLRIFLR